MSRRSVREGGAVGDRMVESAIDEDTIGEFCDLDGEEWDRVPIVVHGFIKREEGLDDAKDKATSRDIRRGYVHGGSMDESSSFVIAFYGDRERWWSGVVFDGGEMPASG